MEIKIYDSHNKQWLAPMSITFDSSNEIYGITACRTGKVPIEDGFWTFEGEDLSKIAIVGEFNINEHLLPKNLKDKQWVNQLTYNGLILHGILPGDVLR